MWLRMNIISDNSVNGFVGLQLMQPYRVLFVFSFIADIAECLLNELNLSTVKALKYKFSEKT